MGDFVSAPTPTSGGFSKEEHLGELVVIEIFGLSKETGDYGEQDVIIGNVHMLDGPMAGHVYEDQTIYGTRLVGQARATLNQNASRMVGRLARGQAKKGQPPWILAEPSAADLALAERWAASVDGPAEPAAAPPPGATTTAAPSTPPTSTPPTVPPSAPQGQPPTASPIAVAPAPAAGEPPF
jgi:hypothetical protein